MMEMDGMQLEKANVNPHQINPNSPESLCEYYITRWKLARKKLVSEANPL